MLPVGTTIQLVDSSRNVKMQSRIIGWEPDQCVMVDQPIRGSDSVQLQRASPVVVRGIHEGRIMGFESSVLAQVINPFRVLFLSFPEQLEEYNFRKHQRVNAEVEAFATRRTHDPVALSRSGWTPRGTIRDISPGGCEFSFHFRLEKDMPIFISCELPDGSVAENVMGFVRSVRRDLKGNTYGIQFDDRSGSLDGISKFVEMSLKILSSTPLEDSPTPVRS
ncbi:flagellar brake protein [Nitrospinota bacterium]